MRKHLLMVLLLAAAVMAGLSAQAAGEIQGSSAMPVQAQPKYVFMFIGDGMSHVQINAAQVLKGGNEKGKLSLKPLTFTSFPVLGLQTTYDATSFCPDSASTATSLSSGYKTHSGTLGLGIDKQMLGKTIAEQVKE
jgi:alkaline phosphatase